ncbi:MAG: radical SAM protein [Candidatus Eisenbacteria bacterium]
MATHAPELPPYRPPSEAGSILIRVTRGCAWNRCTFCGMYKSERFSIRSLAEVEEDLEALKRALPGDIPSTPGPAGARGRRRTPSGSSVFLGDSDCLVHPELLAIVSAVRRTFPDAARITAYTRLHTLWRRAPAYLRALREAGLSRVHAGLESGASEVLARTCKGIDPARAIEGAQQARAAGFELSLYVLSGLGGEEGWEAHARESARVVAAAPPRFLRLRSLVVLPGTPLEELRHAQGFTPVSPLARLRETRLLVAELASRMSAQAAPASEIELCSDHFSNYIWGDGELIYGGVNGYLPSDRDLLLAMLDETLATATAKRKLVDPGSFAARGRAPGLYGVAAL